VALDKDEIHLRKMEGFSIPVFSERSSFFELVGSFKGPSGLAERHNRYSAEESL